MITIKDGFDDDVELHVYFREWNPDAGIARNHFVKNGEPFCAYGVEVPDTQSLEPLRDLSQAEWIDLMDENSNTCNHCRKRAASWNIGPKHVRED